jgi:hypothetical protein
MSHPRPNPSRLYQTIEIVLLMAAAVFLSLHAFHLRADFPNYSPWMDWAKYTDEGWYGDAAIRYFQRGHWYVPGDFNPAAALPIWPLLEAALFRFTGVSLTAARALSVATFGLILLSSYLLLRRSRHISPVYPHPAGISLAPAIAVLLLAVSPFCYAFTRLAILEPLLVLLALLALLAASYITPEQGIAIPFARHLPRHILPIVTLGLLVPLMVLAKTTAIFLLPAVVWMLWARSGYRLRTFLRLGVPVAVLAAVVWLSYYAFLIRPYFLSDFQYLFSANGYTGITPGTAFSVLSATVADGLWIGQILYPLAILAAASAFLIRPRLLRNPLIPALLLWAAGYAAFLAYHNNLQPRYYLVIAVPLTLLVPLVFEAVWTSAPNLPLTPLRRLGTASIVAVLAVITFTDARQTLHFVRTPEYTFTSAAAHIRTIIAADPSHNPLILSISGSNLSLMTGLPSICDDFGTMDLAMRVRAYHPGWYVTWNQVDDDKMEALAPLYHLHRVAAFPAMDDPDRNLLILYRLDPAAPGTPPRRHHHRNIPRLLQTSFGQQPSVDQLEH